MLLSACVGTSFGKCCNPTHQPEHHLSDPIKTCDVCNSRGGTVGLVKWSLGLLLSWFSLLVFQGVGFLCLKLPVLLDYCVKANKQAASHTQFSAHWYCLLMCVILFVLSGLAQICSLDLNSFLTSAYLGSAGQIVVSPIRLLFFFLWNHKKRKK